MATVNPFGFLQQWESWYPQSLPVGHLLREAHPDRWLRIYSLPGGRRYPETDTDWAELVNRQLAAADVVLGRGAECVLVAAYVGDLPDDRWFSKEFDLAPLALVREDFPEDGSEPEDHALDLWVTPARWEPSAFEPAIRRRADDRGPAFLLVALATGRVYAPYDGGADLFAPDARTRLEFRAALRPWVSPRRDGL
jgi:hypothetical protein